MTEAHNGQSALKARTLQYQSISEPNSYFAVSLGVIGLRLLGIYLILQLLNLVQVLGWYYWNPFWDGSRGSPPRWYMLVTSGSPHVLLSIAGVILFWRAASIARRIFGDLPSTTSALNAQAVLMVALVAVGIYLALDALPLLLGQVAHYLFWYQRASDPYRYSQILTSAVRLIAGVLLCIFATRIARFWSVRTS